MAIGNKRVGGALVLTAAAFFGRESIAWLWGRILDLASDGVDGVSWAAFPWQNALVTVMAVVGGYLAFWPDKKPKKASPAQLAAHLGFAASNLVARINAHKAPFGRVAESRDPLSGIIHEGVSLLLKFEKAGIRVPDMSELDDNERCALCLLDYLSRMGALLRDGHLEEARVASEQLSEQAVIEAKEMLLGFFR